MSVDPRWGGSEARLVERLRDDILSSRGQRITFARFMERALVEPDLGYYATSERRPTRSGDFLTAPELHPFFGRCMARFVAAAWARAGSPVSYVVREYGAGRGTLREGVSRGLEADGSLLAGKLEWQAIDLPARSDDERLAACPALVVANEYLDALPVHRVIQRDGLKEVYVVWQDGWFSELVAEPSCPELAQQLDEGGIELAPGQRAEICLQAPRWMHHVASSAALVLVIDYGHDAAELYESRRMAGSLLTYRRHVVADDPFTAVGQTDITAHVDVSALRRAAAAAGMTLLGSTTQARFLAELGLGQLLSDLGQDPATAAPEYLEARSSVARLLDPRHLGGFRTMVWGWAALSDSSARLPGFEATS